MITLQLKDGKESKYFLCSHNYVNKIIACDKDREKIELLL